MSKSARITKSRLYLALAALIRSNDLEQNFGTDLFENSTEADQDLMERTQKQAAALLEHVAGKI